MSARSAALRPIPSDPVLPGLEELLRPDGTPRLVVETVRELTGGAVDEGAGKLCYVRYRPARNCVALWSLPTSSGHPLLVSGKLFRDGTGSRIVARDTFQRLAERVGVADGEGDRPYRYLPERQLLLQLFPLDVRLPGLSLAASAKWVGEALSPLLPVSDGAVSRADVIASSYKPWRRCVFRYAVDGRARRVGYVGKVFRDGRGEQMLARLRSLRQQLVAAGAPWEIPPAVAYLEEARLLVFEALVGAVGLRTLLSGAVDDHEARVRLRDCVGRAAEGLAALQASLLTALPRRTPREVLWRLRRTMGELRCVDPSLAHAVEGRLRALDEKAARLPREPLVPAHGAFRHDQFLLAGDRLLALDLDTLCLSGASADAGNFLAYLDLTALRRPRLRPALETCEEAFLSTLEEQALLDLEWVAWYRTAARVKKALRSLFSLAPGWPDTAATLLRPAELAGVAG